MSPSGFLVTDIDHDVTVDGNNVYKVVNGSMVFFLGQSIFLGGCFMPQ